MQLTHLLTKDEAEKLRAMIIEVRQMDDLMHRATLGRTNYTYDEIAEKFKAATGALDEFFTNSTEQDMSNDSHEVEPAFKLKASVQVYEVPLGDLKSLIARELGVPADRVSLVPIETETGDGDRYSVLTFDGLTVTVKND